jgi:hypothetical protein
MPVRGIARGSQTHCNTITDIQYRPRIVIRNSVSFFLFLEYITCNFKVLNDPPRAITVIPEPTLAAPYLPPMEPTQPGAKPRPSWSTPTSVPEGPSVPSADEALNTASVELLASDPQKPKHPSSVELIENPADSGHPSNQINDMSSNGISRDQHHPLILGLLNSDDNGHKFRMSPSNSQRRPLFGLLESNDDNGNSIHMKPSRTHGNSRISLLGPNNREDPLRMAPTKTKTGFDHGTGK